MSANQRIVGLCISSGRSYAVKVFYYFAKILDQFTLGNCK